MRSSGELKMRAFSRSGAGVACLAMAAVANVAHGAEEAVLQEVMVTASKRGESSVLETPIALQAITSAQLQAQGITQFGDYARNISGLSFEDQGPGDKKIVLRGMQSTGAATTGLYFDDLIITGNNRQDGGGRQPDIRLIDMERIEVLKGPQGSLYGASSMSGTIRMITNKPELTQTSGAVHANASYTAHANDPNYDYDAMLNVPLIEGKVGVRVVGYQSSLAGFIDDRMLGLEGVNNQRVNGGRAALRWQITDDVTLDAMWLNQNTSARGAAYYQPIFGEYQQRNNTESSWEEQLNAYNVALNWEMASGSVTWSVSKMERDIYYRFPGARILCTINGGTTDTCFDPESNPTLIQYRASADQPQNRSIEVSELRYASDWNSPFQIVAGLFWQKEENDFRSRITDVNEYGERLIGREHYNSNRVVNNTIEQRAVFGELSYSFTDALVATVGVRSFEFEVDERGQNLEARTRPVPQDPVYTSSKESDTTFKYNLKYSFDGGAMVYFNYAEGFRNGGNNEPDYATGTVLPAYTSDSVKSYEIGAKSAFLNGALQMDVAAYYMDWEDMQVRVSANIPGSQALMIGNAGQAAIRGVELGLQTIPFDIDLTLGTNLTVLKAELSEDGPYGPPNAQGVRAQLIGFDGDRVPNVPELTASVFADYRFDLGTWEGNARMDYQYVGDSYSDFNATRPVYTEQGDYSLVNLRMSLGREQYKFEVFANNIFDEQAIVTSSIDVRRPLEVIPLRPRTIGVGFGYQF
ncbi:TonB-dependent receptor [Steroidobacter cummioxidans]|uniref:TonB-dependent receptor n=1 Tax=Steroidobacter cummioxidans TaxID=1803913 RepID=UPI000E321B1F|nr:TonB-dependent receptor [Steroidobacter cummioxidans]